MASCQRNWWINDFFPTTSRTDSRYKNHVLNYWQPQIWWVEDNDRTMLEKSSFKEERNADDFFYVQIKYTYKIQINGLLV